MGLFHRMGIQIKYNGEHIKLSCFITDTVTCFLWLQFPGFYSKLRLHIWNRPIVLNKPVFTHSFAYPLKTVLKSLTFSRRILYPKFINYSVSQLIVSVKRLFFCLFFRKGNILALQPRWRDISAYFLSFIAFARKIKWKKLCKRILARSKV